MTRRANRAGASPWTTYGGWFSAAPTRPLPPRSCSAFARPRRRAPGASGDPSKILVGLLDDLPEETRRIVVHAGAYRTAAVFERLRETSRLRGRQSPPERLAWAELAIEASGHDADIVPADRRLAGIQARAWAWMAIVQRQRDDFLEAEKAVVRAKALARATGDDPLVQGEVLHSEAGLPVQRDRLKEAVDAEIEAVDRFRAARAERATAFVCRSAPRNRFDD